MAKVLNAQDVLRGGDVETLIWLIHKFCSRMLEMHSKRPRFQIFPETHAFGTCKSCLCHWFFFLLHLLQSFCNLLKILLKTLDLLVYTSSCVAFFLTQWEKSTVIFPTRPCISFWPRTFSTISWWLGHITNLLICRRIQQKIHETQRICLWLERIRSLHKEFASLLRIQQKIHETHKIWHPSEQNYLLFTSARDSNISRGHAKILKIPEGKGGKFWGLILENPEGRGKKLLLNANPN